MSFNYNNLMKDLTKQIHSKVEQELHSRSYEIECSNCHHKISVKSNTTHCPLCGKSIKVKLKINWK